MDLKLSSELNKYIEKHHGLVWSYLNRKHLDQSEYYDVVIFGFIEAIKKYYQVKPELQRMYRFSTVAYRCMNAKVWKYWRYESAKKRSGVTLSLQETIKMYQDLCLEDAIGYEACYEDVLTTIDFTKLARIFTKKEQQAVNYRLQGYTAKEISNICHTTTSGVYSAFHRVRKKIRRLVGGVAHE